MMLLRPITAGAALALMLGLAGCDGNPFAPKVEQDTSTQGVSVSAASGGAPVAQGDPTTAPAENAVRPPRQPDYDALEQVEDPARVQAFLADALRQGRWRDAARAWGEKGDAEVLQQRFGRPGGTLDLTFGPGSSDAGAGSQYYSAPYTLRLADGSSEKGTLVLRRVNDVSGASPASLRWHVERMDTTL